MGDDSIFTRLIFVTGFTIDGIHTVPWPLVSVVATVTVDHRCPCFPVVPIMIGRLNIQTEIMGVSTLLVKHFE
ncbi:hypothetical protein QJS04_geneDACA024077 [Acorus gramineus]|uniref:Uncharacterized protein n=1 Tax=Acorus gramineus TaxID=55184 RepID=A0AAV9AUU9_ACOGR|nr:hypothetical protein QJS04_geneDACA024077 [Acorus gramineus]